MIVADVMMPGFDGVELTRRLRADPETAAIGILLLTAKAGAEHDPEFNVEALAQAMHLDRSAMFRRLKQLGELAPAELLRDRRLLQAQDLLRRGEGSVTEIAFAVGFEKVSTFTRAFRTRFACAPSSQMPQVAQRRTL